MAHENQRRSRKILLSVCFPTTSLFRIFLLGITIAAITGCAPSLHYSRDIDNSDHEYFPQNWDYSKTYFITESKLLQIVNSYLGVAYKTGGMSRDGFDCSGFVCVVFRELNRARLPHTTVRLKRLGREVPVADARPGDLVFFNGGVFSGINHVGIYMGNKIFVHASSTKGISYDTLNDTYFDNHFAMIRRIF